jgi:hypothetical protein
MFVTGCEEFASTRVPTTRVHTVYTRAPLDWHIKMVAPVWLVDAWEDQFDVCLCRFVELMGKVHHAKIGREVSAIVLGLVIIDASQEGGDSINVCTFHDGLNKCCAASRIIVIYPLLGL